MALVVVPAGLRAEEPAPPPAPVELDRLLKLPESYEFEAMQKGGTTQKEWQERFQKARRALREAELSLKSSQGELEKTASGGAWKLAAPGAAPDDASSPVDYQLREKIKRNKAEVDRAGKRLQELQIEANLENVPDEWRE